MRNNISRKGLVLGIIIMFVGTSAVCSMAWLDNDIVLVNTDGTNVNKNNMDPPKLTLLYPVGGETLNGSVTVKWSLYGDAYFEGTFISYKEVNDTLWLYLFTQENMGVGEWGFEWDTTSVPDGTYQLLIRVRYYYFSYLWNISDTFRIKNHEEPPVNHAPNKPSTPEGSANGKIHANYIYVSMTHDPEGDNVYYLWDWGDGNKSGWLGPSTSGVNSQATHNWTIKGNYAIKVKAKDIHDAESPWSDPLPITMPYTYKPPFLQFLTWLFQQYPHVFPLLRQRIGY